jgi:hypothetical protein
MHIHQKICAALVLLLNTGFAMGATDAEVRAGLRQAANAMSQDLPQQVDRYTRLDAVTPGIGREFQYFFTLTDLKLSSAEVERGMRKLLIAGLCTNPTIAPFKRDRVRLVATYSDPNGRFITKVSATASDCGAS